MRFSPLRSSGYGLSYPPRQYPVRPKRPHPLVQTGTPEACAIVMAILTQHGELGLDHQGLYRAALEQFPSARPSPRRELGFEESDFPPPESLRSSPAMTVPHPEHPIRSMKYLKQTVLKEMEQRSELAKRYFVRGKKDKDGVRHDYYKSFELDQYGFPDKRKAIKVERPNLPFLDLHGVNLAWRWVALRPMRQTEEDIVARFRRLDRQDH